MNDYNSNDSQEKLDRLLDTLHATYDREGGINNVDGINLPSYDDVVDIVRKMIDLLFPGFFGVQRIHQGNLKHWSGALLDEIYNRLKIQVTRSLCFESKKKEESVCAKKAETIVMDVLERLPEIRRTLKTDVEAAFEGDPAAKTHEEVIISYPGIQAIAMHRIAHEFYNLKVPLIPRMISEYSHRLTGIDIHPGATIDDSFFIDHGTGVVIGETCNIGKNVKVYQQVTLGALSFKKDSSGKIVKGLKRHPTIEDDVILYSGCTILGGETVIGQGAVIGGNVWITESVEKGTVIVFDVTQAEYQVFNKQGSENKPKFQGDQ